MGGELRPAVPSEEPGVRGNAPALDEDLDCIRESQELRGRPGTRCRDRVTVGVELDERGLGDGRRACK